VIEAATRVMNEMATFASAGVDEETGGPRSVVADSLCLGRSG